jgi:hypothetical protein
MQKIESQIRKENARAEARAKRFTEIRKRLNQEMKEQANNAGR